MTRMSFLPQNDQTTSWLRSEAQKGNISARSAEKLIGAAMDPYLYDFVRRKGMSLSAAVKALDDDRPSPMRRRPAQRVAEVVKHIKQAVLTKSRAAAPPRRAPSPSSSAELITTPRPADGGDWDRAIAKVNAEFKVGSPR